MQQRALVAGGASMAYLTPAGLQPWSSLRCESKHVSCTLHESVAMQDHLSNAKHGVLVH